MHGQQNVASSNSSGGRHLTAMGSDLASRIRARLARRNSKQKTTRDDDKAVEAATNRVVPPVFEATAPAEDGKAQRFQAQPPSPAALSSASTTSTPTVTTATATATGSNSSRSSSPRRISGRIESNDTSKLDDSADHRGTSSGPGVGRDGDASAVCLTSLSSRGSAAAATAAADGGDQHRSPALLQHHQRPPSSSLHSIHESPTEAHDDDDDDDGEDDIAGDESDSPPETQSLASARATPLVATPAAVSSIAEVPSGRQTPSPHHLHHHLLLHPDEAELHLHHSQQPYRRQSLLPTRQTSLIKTLLHSPSPLSPTTNPNDASQQPLPIHAAMVTRKLWVKRSGASATLVTINEDDLVDDVRDMILRKYANSLGRTFDSPDLALKICPRENHKERILGPEEPMGRTLDAYFPGGQGVDEALIIDVPRRTPKASPRAAITLYHPDDGRPSEAGEGYFPPVGGGGGTAGSPHIPLAVPVQTNGAGPHSIAVLGTGHIPPIPSPGGTRSRAYRDRPERPRLGRTHTSSPTILNNGSQGPMTAAASTGHGTHHHYIQRPSHSRTHSSASDHQAGLPPTAPPLPTSPGPEAIPIPVAVPARVATPPPRVASPRSSSTRPRKMKKSSEYPTLPAGMLNGGVPPISVLIVEDNPINLKLLEAFVKRLKVRWQTAMNGRDAVKKWRTGGFHLVLMDIQLPVMNGLDATREIRRLERVNSIGAFSLSPGSVPSEAKVEIDGSELQDQDRLENATLFKSPVIIVALTASSLQSDRHEALAAGCNDFLTKPVNFVWLERKVMEWGCMQALIDFDGWRKWKDFSQETQEQENAKKTSSSKAKTRKNRSSLSSST